MLLSSFFFFFFKFYHFKPVIIFKFIFVNYIRFVFYFFSFASSYLVVPAPFDKKNNTFATFYCLYIFVKDQLTVFMKVYFWALYSVSLICLFPRCLNYHSFIVSL